MAVVSVLVVCVRTCIQWCLWFFELYAAEVSCVLCFFFQAEDGIRDAQESRGLGDVYKRQV